jgi:hypothetical protein
VFFSSAQNFGTVPKETGALFQVTKATDPDCTHHFVAKPKWAQSMIRTLQKNHAL